MTKTTAVAPRLPQLLDAMLTEIEARVKTPPDNTTAQQVARHILLGTLIEKVKTDAEKAQQVQYYSHNNMPAKFDEHVLNLQISMERLQGFLNFREQLAAFEKDQQAKIAAGEGSDFEVHDSPEVDATGTTVSAGF